MPDPGNLRDSTQIVLQPRELAAHREALESEFTLTVVEEAEHARVIGSPVEIKAAEEFLARNGVHLDGDEPSN
jgi:hypothetical protein